MRDIALLVCGIAVIALASSVYRACQVVSPAVDIAVDVKDKTVRFFDDVNEGKQVFSKKADDLTQAIKSFKLFRDAQGRVIGVPAGESAPPGFTDFGAVGCNCRQHCTCENCQCGREQ